MTATGSETKLPDRTTPVDTAIVGGFLVDGTGNPGRYADVGIVDGHIILPNRNETLSGTETIDATGKVVAPGFIDMHAHSGLMLLNNPHHEAKLAQGVTTELVGVDGLSYAPFPETADLLEFVAINAGLDGNPNLDYNWLTVADYLSKFDGTTSVNVAMLVGNSALRIATKGWNPEAATASETADMAALFRESLDMGAFGLSTGLDYPPSSFASKQEITALAKVSADYGGMYHTHVRNWLGDGHMDPHREAEDICRQSGCHLHVTHLYKRGWSRGSARQLLELVEGMQKNGPGGTFDTYTYAYGSTRVCFNLPRWAFEEGLQGLQSILSQSSGPVHDRLLHETVPRGFSWDDVWITNFQTRKYQGFDGWSVSAIAASLNMSPQESVRVMLFEDGLQLSQVVRGSHIDTRPMFLTHQLSAVGSDALLLGNYPSPRTYGAFSEIIDTYVRAEGMLPLEDAIRKMTSFPAQLIGLPYRGLLCPGYQADIVVFDLNNTEAPSTRANPRVLARGVHHVFVNGIHTWTEEGHTGRFGGRGLRRGS